MTEHSPTPWRVVTDEDNDECDIYSAQGTPVCTMSHFPDNPEADAALIVEAVNANGAWREERWRLQLAAASAEKAFEEADARRTLLERYFCEVYAERDRLRDIVRRLVSDWERFVDDGPLSYPDERQRAATIREAREALGENRP